MVFAVVGRSPQALADVRELPGLFICCYGENSAAAMCCPGRRCASAHFVNVVVVAALYVRSFTEACICSALRDAAPSGQARDRQPEGHGNLSCLDVPSSASTDRHVRLSPTNRSTNPWSHCHPRARDRRGFFRSNGFKGSWLSRVRKQISGS